MAQALKQKILAAEASDAQTSRAHDHNGLQVGSSIQANSIWHLWHLAHLRYIYTVYVYRNNEIIYGTATHAVFARI